eukprot:TRINITY_DN121038_c0_g1_i1.p1 TRINITY_DN121038_c0_g1~~TRINITY_DN121038_c0_g1_i1.p1  ORF type:complete len:591 (+),score=26.67 TRINITY_DN121038_c0_g1_i1:186-1775(+)
MMKGWQPQAKKWLADDIGADPNVFEYLHFKTEAGRKLTIKIPFINKAIDLEMQFEQGLCYFDVLASKFETELSALFNKFDNVVVFDHAQLTSLKHTIAPLLVEAIRNQKFSHPYPNHAIKSVLGIRKDITSYAKELGVTPLALAGVLADEYEGDLAPKIKQVFTSLEDILLAAVARNFDSTNDAISFSLTLLSHFIKKGNIYWTLADILWSLLPKRARQDLVEFAVKAIERSLTDLPESILTSLAETLDQLSEASLKVQLNLEAELEALKKDIAQCGKEMKGYTIKKGLADLITFGSALWYGGGQESIKSRATKIKTHLDHANLPPDQREYVCKWERLYPYFKAQLWVFPSTFSATSLKPLTSKSRSSWPTKKERWAHIHQTGDAQGPPPRTVRARCRGPRLAGSRIAAYVLKKGSQASAQSSCALPCMSQRPHGLGAKLFAFVIWGVSLLFLTAPSPQGFVQFMYLACQQLIVSPVQKGLSMPARQAYSHSASEGRRQRYLPRSRSFIRAINSSIFEIRSGLTGVSPE